MSAFTPGSVSLRLYPHVELTAPEIVEELRTQASLAAEHGFDGVMTSEHHGGFGGYLPNPLQLAGWLLEAMPRGWAAPCPLLLPLRPAALVAEERNGPTFDHAAYSSPAWQSMPVHSDSRTAKAIWGFPGLHCTATFLGSSSRRARMLS